jgi:proline dehydrogenase
MQPGRSGTTLELLGGRIESERDSDARLRPRRFGRIRHRRAVAYRAGPGLDDALAVCRRLASCGMASAIGYSARPGERAADVARAHLRAFEALAAADLDGYVSVKLPPLDFDPRLVGEPASAAAQSGRRLHLDAVAPSTVDATWRLLERAAQTEWIGTTLPARWRRSAADVERAAELGVRVRVVKGQWADGAGPVDAAAGLLDLVDRLRGHAAGVGVATHASGLLADSLRRLQATETPCGAELFYGLPFRAPVQVARELGAPVCVYVAYGDVGAPYAVTDVFRNRAAAWWLTQDLLFGEDKTWRDIRWLQAHR